MLAGSGRYEAPRGGLRFHAAFLRALKLAG
jgi:hypothetical protein